MAPKTTSRGGVKRTTREDFCGMDPEFMTHLIKKIPRNPSTGKADMLEIMKYMEEHPDEMEKLLAETEKSKIGKPVVDLAKFDYQALARTIVHESFWVIQLEHLGFVDKNGREVDPARAHTSTGVKPAFMIYCYDDKNSYRVTKDCAGLPDSNTVLEAIQQAIADPIMPRKPSLPWFLLVSIKFSAHAGTLKPFLDSLPSPFHWRFETPQEADGVNEGVHELNKEGVKIGMTLAEKSKAAGNQAFAKKDRKAALKAYNDALGHLVDALSQKPDTQEEEKATKMRAICYANRAAAYLIPGEGMDAKKALGDGEDAEKVDPSYAKAYIRQAAANEALGNIPEAQDCFLRALRRKDLENDPALVNCFLKLIREKTPQAWLAENPANFNKVKGIGGELQKRLSVA